MRRLIAALLTLAALPLAAAPTPPRPTVDAFMAAHEVPGMAVVLIEEGTITYVGGYGVRNAAGERVTPQTQFILGPGVTLLTEVAARHLIAEGALAPGEPVGAVLPCYTGPETIDELLANAAPLPLDLMTHKDQRAEALTEAACAADAPAALVLGAVIAEAHGGTYENALTERVIEPLGMAATSARPQRSVAYSVAGPLPTLPRMADGHRYWFGTPRPEPDLLVARVMAPAGMTVTTAEDMARLLLTLDEPVAQIGYAPHFSSAVILTEAGRGVVILANAGLEPTDMAALAAELVEASPPDTREPIRVPPLLSLVVFGWAALSGGLAWSWRRSSQGIVPQVALPLLVDIALAAALVAGGVALSGYPVDVAMLYDPAGAGLLVGAVLFTLAFGFGRSATVLTKP